MRETKSDGTAEAVRMQMHFTKRHGDAEFHREMQRFIRCVKLKVRGTAEAV
jgi:hypothetical protein